MVNLSEEEKKAIEYLKNKHIYFDEYEACEDFETENKIDIVLNLIDRLQKELEYEKDLNEELQIRYTIEHEKYLEEKEKNKKLKKENEALEIIHKTYKEVCDTNRFILTDKIKDKIKELEELFDKNEKEITIQYQNQFIVDVVGVLEDILKENKI